MQTRGRDALRKLKSHAEEPRKSQEVSSDKMSEEDLGQICNERAKFCLPERHTWIEVIKLKVRKQSFL